MTARRKEEEEEEKTELSERIRRNLFRAIRRDQ